MGCVSYKLALAKGSRHLPLPEPSTAAAVTFNTPEGVHGGEGGTLLQGNW